MLQNILQFRRNQSLVLALLAVVAAIIPVAVARIPGFTDMPSHMARQHIMAEIGHNPAIDGLFSVHWRWTANLGVDLCTLLLSPFLSTETAVRLVAGLIAPLTAGGLFALSRAAHGRIAPSAFIALPLIFNQAWMWGFQNFGLGTALALFVAAWMMRRPEREWYRQAWLAALALMVWTAHLGSWGILLVLAAGQELAGLRQMADLGRSIRRTWPLFVPLVPLVLWRAGAQGHSSGFVSACWPRC